MAEEFGAPRQNLITSSNGFSVELLERTGIRYSEKARSVVIESEGLAIPGAMALYGQSFKTWTPGDESITDEDRARIIDDVRRAFAYKRYELQVI